MRNFIKTFSIILSLIILSSTSAFAADSYISLNGFVFDINEDGKAVIHEYDGSQETVLIPETLMGAEVAEIDDYAFFQNTVIKNVSFENASFLKRIGDNAFYGCENLTKIELPESLTELSFGAFQNCTGLKEAVLKSGISKIPEQLFLNCVSLSKVVIPSSVTEISDNAFSGCGNLVIYAHKGSTAYNYAESGNIPLVIADSLLGDVDLDGKVNIRDVTFIQKYKVGKYQIKYTANYTADVNGDGKITVRDASILQMYLAKEPVKYDINKKISLD